MHLSFGQCLVAKGNVAIHGIRKEKYILRSDAQMTAQLLELPILYVATVHFHAAGANVIAAGKKIDDGGFA